MKSRLGLQLLVCALLVSTSAPAFSQTESGTIATPPPAELPPLRGTLSVPIKHEPKASELDTTKGQVWHRASFQLVGSMCPACLLELEHKLSALPGVQFSQIHRPSAEDKTEHHKTATAVVIYDIQSIPWRDLQKCIKDEGYRASDLVDADYK